MVVINEKLNPISRIHIVSFSFITWFLAGFDLLQITLLLTPAHYLFFPMFDKPNEVLVIYAILSLTLFSRILGGIYFGRYADNNGRVAALRITIAFITLIMLSTALFPYFLDIHHLTGVATMIPFAVLVFSRCILGFCIGGLYPTAAVFAFENYKRNKQLDSANPNQNLDTESDLQQNIRKNTFASAIIQSGFHAGYLFIAFILFRVLTSGNYESFSISTISNFNSTPALTWTISSFLGAIMGFLLYIWLYLITKKRKIYDEGVRKFKNISLKNFLLISKNSTLLQAFWLLTTGLFYIYYFAVSIIILVINRSELYHENNTMMILLLAVFIAHMILGPTTWFLKKKYGDKIGFLEWFYVKMSSKRWSILLPTSNYAENEDDKRLSVKNYDLLMVFFVAFLTFVLAIFGVYLYSGFIFDKLNESFDNNYWLIMSYTIIIILVSNASWGLIPSILSSRFSNEVRSMGTSFAYNGGLIIAFVLPFLSVQFVLSFPQWQGLLFIPMSIGAISMMIGAKRIISSTLSQNIRINVGDMKIRELRINIPSKWEQKEDITNQITVLNSPVEKEIPNSSPNASIEIHTKNKNNINGNIEDNILSDLAKRRTASILMKTGPKLVAGVLGNQNEYAISSDSDGDDGVMRIVTFELNGVNFTIVCNTIKPETYNSLFDRILESIEPRYEGKVSTKMKNRTVD